MSPGPDPVRGVPVAMRAVSESSGCLNIGEGRSHLEVLNNAGNVVGPVETRLLGESDEISVKDPDGQTVGHSGPKGYQPLGGSEPGMRGSVTAEE